MVDTAEFNLVPDNEEEEFVVDFGEVTNVGGGGGTSDFNKLTNRPKYDNQTMTGNTNIPKVPTKTSDLDNDSDFQTGTEVSSAINTAIGDIDIPSKTSDLTNDGSDGTSTYVEADELATVAKSGSYTDLENKPTIPIVNNSVLTITQNNDTKGIFTANDANDVTIALTDTTNITILTDDDANYTKSGEDYIALWLLPSGKYTLAEDATVEMVSRLVDGGPSDGGTADMNPIALITNSTTSGSSADIVFMSSEFCFYASVDYDTGISSEFSYISSPFVGTDGNDDGIAGLVPAPTTSDAGKFLKSDGTWDTAGGGGGPTVVQTTGTSQTDVMSQNATTSMVYADPATKYNINIGGTGNPANGGAVLLHGSSSNTNAIAIGMGSNVQATGGIALGSGARATSTGEMNIGTLWTSNGYNNTNYRLLTGLHDPVNAQDAATKAYVDANAGGPTVVQTTGAITTDVMSQNAVTSMVFADPANATRVSIGNANAGDNYAVSIGNSAYGAGEYSIALGYQSNTYNGSGAVAVGQGARARTSKAIAIGYGANTGNDGGASAVAIGPNTQTGTESVAIGENAGLANEVNTVSIGRGAKAWGRGSVAIGDQTVMNSNDTRGTVSIKASSTGYGYNGSSQYRLLTGLYDGQNAQDAVNLGQLDARVIGSLTAAPTTSTVGSVGSLVATVESGTGHLYICTSDTGGTYTWSQLV